MKVPEVERPASVQVMTGAWSPASVIQEVVSTGHEDPFYVLDLGQVVARYRTWKELMPNVEPFYAVKCNDDRMLVSTLAALGASFDCASKAEIELVTSLGVEPHRIIFANPAKMSSHIRRADALGVDLMTFDSEVELLKIKHLMPHARLVVRIRCDATEAQCPLGMKFGCDPNTEAPRLLKLAAVHGLNVVGVSFHAGSGARDLSVWSRGIKLCAGLMSAGRKLGHSSMDILDIGGGFPGDTQSDLLQISSTIKAAIEAQFPHQDVRVIAEPGRYFAAACATLATLVHSAREILPSGGEGEAHTMYFINDGVYGSFNCVLYDHQQVKAIPLQESSSKPISCSIWGPSCDGLDCVIPLTNLPPLAIGSWLMFRDMGAYTMPIASPFNGFPTPTVRYVIDEDIWTILKDMLPLTSNDFISTPLVSPSCSSPSSPLELSPPASPPMTPQHLGVYVECALK